MNPWQHAALVRLMTSIAGRPLTTDEKIDLSLITGRPVAS